MQEKYISKKDEALYEKAMAYLDENKASFGIEIEYMKQRMLAQLMHRQCQEQNPDSKFDWSEWLKLFMQDLL